MIRIYIICSLFVASLCGLICVWPRAACQNEDAYIEATLHILADVHLYPIDDSGCGWLDHCSDDDIIIARRRAKDIRVYASTETNSCARAAFLGWANFVDYQVAEGVHQMETHEHNNEFNEWQRKNQETDKAASDIERAIRNSTLIQQ